MSPKQKAVGYVVFLIVLAAIAMMLIFVGGPVADKLRQSKSVAKIDVMTFYDENNHVTCWIAANSISCLPNKDLR